MEYNELIQAFAEKARLAELAASDGAAAVEIDGIKIAFLHDEKENAVTIYGEIGFPPPDADGAFGGAMLRANHLFNGTDGAVLCQNPETFAYALFRRFPLAGMDAEAFFLEVGKLVDQVEGWQRMLNGFREVESAADDAREEAAEFDAMAARGAFIRI